MRLLLSKPVTQTQLTNIKNQTMKVIMLYVASNTMSYQFPFEKIPNKEMNIQLFNKQSGQVFYK